MLHKLKSHVCGLLETIVLVLSESFKASSMERVICILMFKSCSLDSRMHFSFWLLNWSRLLRIMCRKTLYIFKVFFWKAEVIKTPEKSGKIHFQRAPHPGGWVGHSVFRSQGEKCLGAPVGGAGLGEGGDLLKSSYCADLDQTNYWQTVTNWKLTVQLLNVPQNAWLFSFLMSPTFG